jgi:AcrR family transcriptional regulator
MTLAATALPKLDRPRLTETDWERAALELIADDGVAAVAVETLARRLNVTKGSFYWHFENRDALLKAALERWEQHDIQALDTLANEVSEPHDRLRELFRRTSRRRTLHAIYAALIAAREHPIVGPLMNRITERRMAFLARGFRELNMRDDQAEHRARLAYAAYVGFLQLTPHSVQAKLSTDAFDAYVEHMIETLIP